MICPICNTRKVRCKGKCDACYRRDKYANDPIWKARIIKQRKEFYKDKPNLLKKVSLRAHQTLKIRNLEYLMSVMDIKCQRCGYNKCFAALEGHHLDPTQKETRKDALGYWIRAYSLKKLKEKLENTQFIILCANCHREKHFEKGEINATTN